MRDFPFWRLALSIAAGILIANAVTWFAAETRLRYEVREATLQLQAMERKRAEKREADDLARKATLTAKYEAEFREKAAAEREQAQRDAAYERERQREQREGRHFPAAHDAMAVGTFACRSRQIVRRQPNGWLVAEDGTGKPARCRTEP